MKKIYWFLLLSLPLTFILIPFQSQGRDLVKVTLIKNLPDGVYKAEIPLINRNHNSADLYITFRKTGRHIVGIPSYSNSVSDYMPEYWERSCIEGDINKNAIIGYGVVVDNKEIVTKSEPISDKREWFNSYRVEMRGGKLYKSKPVLDKKSRFAVISIYSKAIGNISKVENVKKISSFKVPLSCKSLVNDTFNKSFEVYRN